MSTAQADFDQLQHEMQRGGVPAVLARLVEQLREQKKYHEMFEALKMQVRHRLDLPLLYSDSGDDLEESRRNQLEDGLIDACRQVGLLLLEDGRVHEGWMYLRPVGDQAAAARAISQIEVDEDNLEEIIEVTLQEGVDTQRGFALVLEHYGTCNAITTFESTMPQRSRSQQQQAASLLLRHVHKELLATVKADIAQQEEGTEPAESTLGELVAQRDWLFGEHAYHIDTTHLASTVRFARLLEDHASLRLALDLTEYGRRLSGQFQYQGEEPFRDLYPSHAFFFQALLGENVEQAVDYFRQRAEQADIAECGSAAIEVYVDLLARLGRYQQAMEASITMMPPDLPPLGHAPSLLELATKAGCYQQLLQYYRQRDDLLRFATSLVQASHASPS